MEEKVRTKAELLAEIEKLKKRIAKLEGHESQRQVTNPTVGISEQHLRILIDTIPDMICLKDSEGRWLEANYSCLATFEIDRQSYRGKTDVELAMISPFYSGALKMCAASDEYAWQTGSPTVGEEIVTKPDGSDEIFTVTKVPIFYEDGRRKGLVVLCRNITKIKRDEELLRRQEREYKALVDHTPDIIGRITRDGKILFVNSAVEQLIGAKPQQLIGRSVDEFIGDKYCRVLRSRMNQVFNSGKAYTGEGEFSYGAKKYYYHVHYVPEFNNDGIVASMQIIARDISDRKLMENEMARLDRLSLVGEMAASIGHEVRNPMTTVRGFLQMLTMKKSGPDYKEYYEMMISELDRANAIITELLSLAKNKAVNKAATDINAVAEAMLPLLKAEGIVGNKDIRADLKAVPLIFADGKEIRQLILNLVLNGFEAMAEGGLLTIKTYCDNDDVILAVQDDGCGIPGKIADKIGTPFFTTKEQGTGLGLAVCHSIANRHNAQITFEPGVKGTTFYVKFKPYYNSTEAQNDERR